MAKVIKYCLVIGAILLLQDIIIKCCGFLLDFNHLSNNIFRNLPQRVLKKSLWGFLFVFSLGFFDLKLWLELCKPNTLNKKRFKTVSDVQFILLQFSCSYIYVNVLGSMFNSNWKKKILVIWDGLAATKGNIVLLIFWISGRLPFLLVCMYILY